MNIHAPKPPTQMLNPAAAPLVDPFGRAITYVRVSVTDRCDFRCVYCMSEDMHFLPKQDLLTLEELDRLCAAFIARGTRKLRITGGEPLVRRNIMSLFRSLSRHLESGALEELTVTTNGSQLAQIVAGLTMNVNSAHHQAVKLVAPGLVTNAVAPDGVIEGIEDPTRRYFIGVQWHPEFSIDPGDAKLFTALIAACRR